MSLRTDLEQRADVSNDDIGEIVEIAQRLQREAEARAQSLSVEEIGEIAEDLDIDASYVEQAIELRKQEQARALAASRQRAATKRRLAVIGASLAAVIMGIVLILALVGASALSGMHSEVQEAQGRLDQVLQRFAASAPQGVALLGIDTSSLADAASAVREAKDTEARMDAAHQLHRAISELLASQAPGDAAAQERLNLHYELTGFQNRITTESERLRLVEAKYKAEQQSLTGRLAMLLGMGS